MNLPWIYRVFALTMAFFVGISSVSWAVVEHYCQGALRNVSLIVDTGSCHDSANLTEKSCKMDGVSCCSAQKSEQKDCCTDEVDLLDYESIMINPMDDDSDLSDSYVSASISFEQPILWPMAKINPVRGPCAEPPWTTCPLRADIQIWLI